MRASYEETPRRRPGIGLEWQRRRACIGKDPGPWMSSKPAQQDIAKALCANCPVRLSCLGYALDWERQIGYPEPLIFGGLTAEERRVLIGAMR